MTMMICDEAQLNKIRQDAADKKKNKRLLDIRKQYDEYVSNHMNKAYNLDDFWYQTAGEELTPEDLEKILNTPGEHDMGNFIRGVD